MVVRGGAQAPTPDFQGRPILFLNLNPYVTSAPKYLKVVRARRIVGEMISSKTAPMRTSGNLALTQRVIWTFRFFDRIDHLDLLCCDHRCAETVYGFLITDIAKRESFTGNQAEPITACRGLQR
jgi:hypothetical protein